MKHLIMGTAGHVDHGKTALIKTLTNIDCDTHKEEKKRGITINLGFSHFDLPSGDSIGIIDVPGHKDFISTMVSGACGIDFVMLVIASDSGIMPQTVEHFNIVKTLNIKKGIVALTKVDLVDEDLVELAKLEILEMLEGTSFENAPIVGVSSVTGQGIDELVQSIQEVISDIDERDTNGAFRMYIDRLFTVSGIGCVATGSVLGGEINTGEEVMLLPYYKKKLKIRSIERHGNATNKVLAGDRAAINISGLKSEDFKRGMLLSNKEIQETSIIDAYISIFDENTKLNVWSSTVFLSGTYECYARIHLLNKESVSQGQNGIVQIHLGKPAVLLNKDKFIIRNSSGDKTIGGGFVLDAYPLHHKRRSAALNENLELLLQGFLNENNLVQLIKIELKKINRPVLLNELAELINRTDDEIKETILNDKSIIKYEDDQNYIIIDSKIDNEHSAKIIYEITEYHKKNPILESGIEQSEFAGRLGFSKDKTGKKYIELLLYKLKIEGKIKVKNNTWVLTEHEISIDDKTKSELNWLENMILEYDMQKPVYEDIEKEALDRGIQKDKLRMYITFLNRDNKLCFVKNEYVHRSIIEKCRPLLLAGLDGIADGINNSDLRKILNSTKKLTPFLISYFESEGIITTRMVDTYIYSTITEKGKLILDKN